MLAPNRGVFKVGQFNGVTKIIYPRPTLVAIVTIIILK